MNDSTTQPPQSLQKLTHVMYALHAFSALSGVLSAAFVLTAFLTGWPSIIAVVLNYIKRSDTQGTFLESHFRWQWRTFWFAALWVVLAILLGLTFVGLVIAVPLAVGAGIWVLYRIVRGWLALGDGKPMPI